MPVPSIGDVVAGKYRIERVLGRGGMGVVVAAKHLRLRERVAIKFLLSPMQGASVARFVREARAAMRIRSEHGVRVHDAGTLETGDPYLVMEYLEGSDLAAVLAKSGRVPVEAAVEYVLQAIEALAEAHAAGIIHRDLKPANLFLCRRADGSPLVKVLDFGIAKTTGVGLDTGSVESYGSPGTPLYMAPEQMRSGAAIDARTDVWGLGVTLHALVAGSAPFPPGSLVEIHEHILRGAPALRTLVPDAPESLEAIVARCMQAAPEARFPTVAELAAALGPLAPEHARISVQRAAKILAAPRDPAGEAEHGDDEEAPSSPLRPATLLPATSPPAAPSWLDADGEGASLSRAGESAPVVIVPPRREASPWWRLMALAAAAAIGGIGVFAIGGYGTVQTAALASVSANLPAATSSAPPAIASAVVAPTAIRPVETAEALPHGGPPPRGDTSATLFAPPAPRAAPAPESRPRSRANDPPNLRAHPQPQARDPLADPN